MEGFRKYLELSLHQNTIRSRMAYAKKYSRFLTTWDLSEIMHFSNDKKTHIMRALALLAKYKGCYDKWQKVRNDYQLKWSSIDSLGSFHNILKQDGDFLELIRGFHNVLKLYPQLSNILKFNVLTGLRPSEAINSFNLLLNPNTMEQYLTTDRKILQHFKFPDVFLRRTKKAFISITFEDVLSLTAKENNPSTIKYDTIRILLENEQFKMSYCRKIFATFLRTEGVELEIIDLLQGRISDSIFVRHYYRPSIDKFNEIRGILNKLFDLISRG